MVDILRSATWKLANLLSVIINAYKSLAQFDQVILKLFMKCNNIDPLSEKQHMMVYKEEMVEIVES